MHANQLNRTLLALFFIFPILVQPTGAKRLIGVGGNASEELGSVEKELDTRRLESRLEPFFESVINGPATAAEPKAPHAPTQEELFLMIRHWDRLSTRFKKNYARAFSKLTQPKSHAHPSPGGQFIIQYDLDSVDQADTYGYEANGNWRTRTGIPNGVPDYVDEVAWAFDSSWSMEIDRFGLVEPVLAGGVEGDPYVVQITTQNNGFYGITLPDTVPIASRSAGFGSLIQIRRNWDGADWNLEGIVDYQEHPELAVRITAAHEFLHAIQYAMSHVVSGTIYLDHYPVSWLEASAVLMEELAFDSVNDYLQYIPDFFSQPTTSLFDDQKDYYKNVVFLMYSHFRAHPTDPIAFVRNMLFRNYENPTDFNENLTAATSDLGREWSELHGAFWSSTYFTGTRADTSIFLKDAALMPEWTLFRDYHGDTRDTLSTTKRVSPYAMKVFDFEPEADASDSAILEVFSTESTVPTNAWSVHILPELRGSTRADTMLPVPLSPQGYVAFPIPWKSISTLYAVAANSNPDSTGEITLTIVPPDWRRTEPGDSLVLESKDGEQRARFTAYAVRRLYGDAVLSPVEFSQAHKIAYNRDNLAPACISYEVTFNSSWETGVPMTLTIAADSGDLEPQDIARELNRPQAAVHRYDPWSFSWVPLATTTVPDGEGISWTCTISQPGFFGVLQPKSDIITVADTVGDLRVTAEIPVPVLSRGLPEISADPLTPPQREAITEMGYEETGTSAFLSIPTEWDFTAAPEIILQICGERFSSVKQLPEIESPLTSVYRYENQRNWTALSTRPDLDETCGSWRATSVSGGTFAVLYPLFDTVSVTLERGGSEAELSSILSRHLTTNQPSVTRLRKTEHLERLAGSQNLKPTGLPFYEVRIPDTWVEAEVKSAFRISAEDALVDTLRETMDFLPALTRLYRLDVRAGDDSVWYDMGAGSRDTVWGWTALVEKSGIFGVFQQNEDELRFYPNPVSIGRQQDLIIDGNEILDVTIYTIAGNQVARIDSWAESRAFTSTKNRVLWHLRNNSGNLIVPATYIAVVGYKSLLTRGKELTRKKILVHP